MLILHSQYFMIPHALFTAITILLIIMHFIGLSWFSIEEIRWMRVLTAAVFLGVYFLQISRQTLLLAGALFSFLIADIFSLSYHLEFSKDGFFFFHGIAFSLLFLFITRRTIQKRWSRFQKNYILITSALCLGILLFFGLTFRSEIQGIQHLLFFSFHGLALIACLITALSFYERKADSSSLLFLLAALGLIFSDLTAFPAEYLKAEGFYYFSRIFYVTGLAGLTKFSFFCTPSPKPKAENILISGVLEQKTKTAYHDH